MANKKPNAEPLEVLAGSPEKPLQIGDLRVPCYVLEGEIRVLSQAGFLQAIGRSKTARKPATQEGEGIGFNSPVFLAASNLKPYVSADLLSASTPILFTAPNQGLAYGFDARLLPRVCKVYLDARSDGALLPSQMHVAERAELLLTGLGEVGIIGLVDEATGYESERIKAERVLAKFIELYIDRQLQPWTLTFDYDFYKEIFRLRGWDGPHGVRRPHVVGTYTNNFVYARLAPGVFEELQRKKPDLPSGTKLHQVFTPDRGHPEVRRHIAMVVGIMKTCDTWEEFLERINKALPRKDLTEQLLLSLRDPDDDE